MPKRTGGAAICVLGLTVLAACGGGSSGTTPTAPSTASSVLQYVSVDGTFSLAAAGGTTQLRAVAHTTTQTQDVTSQATWSSSNEAVATVTAGGLVTAKAAGVVAITAGYQTLSGHAGISVATPVNVSGTWSGRMTNPTSSVVMEISHAGDSLSGRSTVAGGDLTFNGTFSGRVEGATVILSGTVVQAGGTPWGSWTDERCALRDANTMTCVNPMTMAQGAFTLTEGTFTRQ